MNQILVPVSLGELIDKITILEIKSERIADPAKLANVSLELQQLNQVGALEEGLSDEVIALRASLRTVNERLWDIEDKIRVKESLAQFDQVFIDLARSVYIVNDERAALKRAISLTRDHALVEEKSYADYRRNDDAAD